jgi:hypothetical protein
MITRGVQLHYLHATEFKCSTKEISPPQDPISINLGKWRRGYVILPFNYRPENVV